MKLMTAVLCTLWICVSMSGIARAAIICYVCGAGNCNDPFCGSITAQNCPLDACVKTKSKQSNLIHILYIVKHYLTFNANIDDEFIPECVLSVHPIKQPTCLDQFLDFFFEAMQIALSGLVACSSWKRLWHENFPRNNELMFRISTKWFSLLTPTIAWLRSC